MLLIFITLMYACYASQEHGNSTDEARNYIKQFYYNSEWIAVEKVLDKIESEHEKGVIKKKEMKTIQSKLNYYTNKLQHRIDRLRNTQRSLKAIVSQFKNLDLEYNILKESFIKEEKLTPKIHLMVEKENNNIVLMEMPIFLNDGTEEMVPLMEIYERFENTNVSQFQGYEELEEFDNHTCVMVLKYNIDVHALEQTIKRLNASKEHKEIGTVIGQTLVVKNKCPLVLGNVTVHLNISRTMAIKDINDEHIVVVMQDNGLEGRIATEDLKKLGIVLHHKQKKKKKKKNIKQKVTIFLNDLKEKVELNLNKHLFLNEFEEILTELRGKVKETGDESSERNALITKINHHIKNLNENDLEKSECLGMKLKECYFSILEYINDSDKKIDAEPETTNFKPQNQLKTNDRNKLKHTDHDVVPDLSEELFERELTNFALSLDNGPKIKPGSAPNLTKYLKESLQHKKSMKKK